MEKAEKEKNEAISFGNDLKLSIKSSEQVSKK